MGDILTLLFVVLTVVFVTYAAVLTHRIAKIQRRLAADTARDLEIANAYLIQRRTNMQLQFDPTSLAVGDKVAALRDEYDPSGDFGTVTAIEQDGTVEVYVHWDHWTSDPQSSQLTEISTVAKVLP